MDTARYAFRVEWLDQQASLKRFYQLFYYTRMDGMDEIELFDLKTRRTFLKRCHYPSVALDDIYIGAKITIYARQMVVLDYEDEATRSALAKAQARCCAIMMPSGVQDLGKVWAHIEKDGLKVSKLKMVHLSSEDAERTFGSRELASGPIVAMELVGPNAAVAWVKAMETLRRSTFGEAYNGFIGAGSAGQAESWLNAIFEPRSRVPSATRPTARMESCTCAVVRPHAVAKGLAGGVLDAVLNCGLQVTAMELFDIDLTAAEEFLEVYKGVVPDYVDMARELSAGALVAVELSGDDAVARFREVAGPRDYDVACRIRPHSIRAKFGSDTVRNALHCTDLPDDGPLESEYFFSIMQS